MTDSNNGDEEMDLSKWSEKKKLEELLLLQEDAARDLPRFEDFPHLSGIDYHVSIEPFGACVGGDLITIVDFKALELEENITNAEAKLAETLKKNRDAFGILIADIAGHQLSTTNTVSYLKGLFTAMCEYELLHNGEVTAKMFERLNRHLYNRADVKFTKRRPYATLLYGEIHNNGTFRYLSAGHPTPIVFSNEHNRIERLNGNNTQKSTPVGLFPTEFLRINTKTFKNEIYPVNEIALLGQGDIMLLYTDGLFERCESENVDHHLEGLLKGVKGDSAKDISVAIRKELYTYCQPEDDVSLVVLKKL